MISKESSTALISKSNDIAVYPEQLCNVIPTKRSEESLIRQYLQQRVACNNAEGVTAQNLKRNSAPQVLNIAQSTTSSGKEQTIYKR